DTESGHLRLAWAMAALVVGTVATKGRRWAWTPRRLRWAVALAWAFPLAAWIGPMVVEDQPGAQRHLLEALAGRCRFGDVPTDDLADWSTRFRDHVGFSGSAGEFARAYLADRHGLEQRYQSMTDAERAALARRQGATHVLAAAPVVPVSQASPLELLHVEGRYAVYGVKDESGTSLAIDP